jgi:hypothetical protein
MTQHDDHSGALMQHPAQQKGSNWPDLASHCDMRVSRHPHVTVTV